MAETKEGLETADRSEKERREAFTLTPRDPDEDS